MTRKLIFHQIRDTECGGKHAMRNPIRKTFSATAALTNEKKE